MVGDDYYFQLVDGEKMVKMLLDGGDAGESWRDIHQRWLTC